MRIHRGKLLAVSLLALSACQTGSTHGGAAAPDGGPCGLGAIWLGDVCTIVDCRSQGDFQPCQQPDGDAGNCIAASCKPLVDLVSDSQNCGDLGAVCPAGTVCSRGACVRNGSVVYFCDLAASCPEGRECQAGRCVVTSCAGADDQLCLPGTTTPAGHCCDGACSSLDDVINCGGCGVVCPEGFGCAYGIRTCVPTATCDAGFSGGTCAMPDGGFGSCCTDACTDLSKEPNCVACGRVCPKGSSCSGGGCGTDKSGGLLPGDCSDGGCPAGTLCNEAGDCIPPCMQGNDGAPCLDERGTAADGTCCGGKCVEAWSDPDNCGVCGNACGTGALCLNNVCTPALDCSQAPSGPCAAAGGQLGTCCEGRCVPTLGFYTPAGDLDCGGCGAACDPATHCDTTNGEPACLSECGQSSCGANAACIDGDCFQMDCANLAANTACALPDGSGTGLCCGGACLPNQTQTTCFYCGYSCPPGSQCSAASCQLDCSFGAACPAGTTCLGDWSGICVADTCGSADDGAFCATRDASGAAQQGVCCAGTCIDSQEDPANCGGCKASCASGACSGGVCFEDLPEPCEVGCGADELCSGQSCLVSLCGEIGDGSFCAANTGTVGVCCAGGACADLLIDPANCGRCGVTCTAGHACAGGVCR